MKTPKPTPPPTTTEKPTPPPTTPCIPTCEWSEWYDEDDSSDKSDWETYENITQSGKTVCEKPSDIECKDTRYPDMSLEDVLLYSDQVVTCDVNIGFICKEKDQPKRPGKCYNYKLRVYCCVICTTPTPTPTTTTTAAPTSEPTPTTTTTTTEPSTPEPTTAQTTKSTTVKTPEPTPY